MIIQREAEDIYRRIDAHHNDQPITHKQLAIGADIWSWAASEFDWDHTFLTAAIDWFYDGDPVPWANGPHAGQPRPILPVDIRAFEAVQVMGA